MKHEHESVPLYRHTGQYAREHGELEQYRASWQASMSCKEAIETAIRENFDGMHLNRCAAALVLAEFPPERVAYVLANTLQQKSWDGRFSHDNKDWSQTVPLFDTQERRQHCVVESHPAVLDGFVKLFRQETAVEKTQAAKRPSIREQLAAAPVSPSASSSPKNHEAR